MARKAKTYPELDKRRDLLGTVPDATVAELAGTSPSIVGRYRRKYNIPAYQGYKFGHDEARKGAEEVIEKVEAGAPLKEVVKAAEKVADRTPPAPASQTEAPVRRSKISPFRDKVGKIPDREIAALAGVTPEAVRMFRRRHGIQLATRVAAPAPASERKPRRRRSKLDPFNDLLGKVPDAEVAAMAGVTSENVRAYRRRHGIAAEWRTAEAPVAAPAPAAAAPVAAAPVAAAPVAAAPAASTGAEAYGVKVAGNDSEYFIVGADIAQAAAAAQKALRALAGDAPIVAIRHLGPAIR